MSQFEALAARSDPAIGGVPLETLLHWEGMAFG